MAQVITQVAHRPAHKGQTGRVFLKSVFLEQLSQHIEGVARDGLLALSGRVVAPDAALGPLAAVLADELRCLGRKAFAVARGAPRRGDIVLSLDTVDVVLAYSVRSGGVKLSARSEVGEIKANALVRFVLEGRGIFSLGEESTEAGPGILLPSPRGVPHGMKNPGPGLLRVLAIKNPRPEGE